MGDAPDRRRLDSWKIIAQHLGRTERTVIRWERERGLPVHRVPGGKSRTVYAYTDELDRWLDRANPDPHDTPVASNLSRGSAWVRARWEIVLPALAFVVATVWVLLPATYAIGSIVVSGNALAALDHQGRVVWHYLPDVSRIDLRDGRIWQAVRDIDESPGNEVVVAGTSASEKPEALLSLTNHGELRWLRSFDEEVAIAESRFGPPWRTADLVIHPALRRVVWTLHHQSGFPSVVAAYDFNGTLMDRIVHPGWLTSVRLAPDNAHLLAAGVNNELDARVMLVLDGAREAGYFVFPRPELSRLASLPLLNNLATPRVVVLPSGIVELHVVEHPEGGPIVDAIYEFGPDLSPRGGRASDAYWDWHRRLETQGRLDHRAADCPERDGLPIRDRQAAVSTARRPDGRPANGAGLISAR